MLTVNYKINAPKDLVLKTLTDNNLVCDSIPVEKEKYRSRMHVKLNGDRVKIQCEYISRATKDNDFLGGTLFLGSIKEKNDRTSLSGLVVTAPLYHLAMIALTVYFIIKCISLEAISIVPICIIVFSLLMFKDEFKKQSLIKRYIFTAFKLTYQRYCANKK